MAHQSSTRYVGEYVVGRQIGSGSFSVVWHARHRVHGTEVAIKEIVTGRLNKKLQESLMSEIVILKQINHPNIIRLHDIIEVRFTYYSFFLITLVSGLAYAHLDKSWASLRASINLGLNPTSHLPGD